MSEPVLIEFGDNVSGGVRRTLGTRVSVGGVEIAGVTRITLHAEPNSLWRATIECIPLLPDQIAVTLAETTTDG